MLAGDDDAAAARAADKDKMAAADEAMDNLDDVDSAGE